jgi:hypothetical protein
MYMGSRQLTKNKKSQGETLAPTSGMLQGRSFAVQGKVEKPDLKTSLMRAERYGHHLNQIGSASVSQPEALQPKMDIGNPVQLARRGEKRPHQNDTAHQPRKRPTKYPPGTYGYTSHEQKALGVSGKTHESEHPIGVQPILQTTGLKRGTPGRAKDLENFAPAYQEEREFHRKHIGTGNRTKEDASGFNAHSYRKTERDLIKQGDISSAMQINQLSYAFIPGFQNKHNTPDKTSKAADDSYKRMVKNLRSVTYGEGEENREVNVNRKQQQEILLARKIARRGKWATEEEIEQAKKNAKDSDK